MPKYKKSKSRYKGIYWHKHRKKWNARIRINGRTIPLGYFNDEISAAKAYDSAAKKLHGRFASPNFP
ncbi:MAG TPA: hypothetical protein HPP51_06040 [Planctomycetes bacterium]|nr:hypothetical protein [Planctomycetota bacterium]